MLQYNFYAEDFTRGPLGSLSFFVIDATTFKKYTFTLTRNSKGTLLWIRDTESCYDVPDKRLKRKRFIDIGGDPYRYFFYYEDGDI